MSTSDRGPSTVVELECADEPSDDGLEEAIRILLTEPSTARTGKLHESAIDAQYRARYFPRRDGLPHTGAGRQATRPRRPDDSSLDPTGTPRGRTSRTDISRATWCAAPLQDPEGAAAEVKEVVRDPIVAQWRDDFLVIYRDVQELAIQRHIYREVVGIAQGIDGIQELDQTFFDWIIRMHSYVATIGIRKQADDDDKAVSLRTLLGAVAADPQRITRSEYVARASSSRDPATEIGRLELEELRHVMNAQFDKFVGSGAPHLSTENVRADIAALKAAAKKVVPYVNFTIAHRDRRALDHLPSWDQVNKAIDVLEQLVRKYNSLLDAGQAPRLVPTWQYDWKRVFRVPWLPSRKDVRSSPNDGHQ